MKKAQDSASGAATLLVLIAVLIVLYVLFIPPNTRDELLNGDLGDTTIENTNSASYKLLIDERPGILNYVTSSICDNNECQHNFGSFSILTKTKAITLLSLNPFIVKNNIFTKYFKKEYFDIEDLDNIDNVLITFSAKEHKGILTIKLNGAIISQQNIETYNIEPISIPKKLLKNHNEIEFSVSSVGALFWKTNQYSIENFRMYSNYKDTSKESGKQTFRIKDDEYNAIDYGKLKFTPDCKQNEVKKLEIKLNGKKIFNAIPDCGILNIIEISKKDLDKGDNIIEFKSEDGNYIIDTLSIWTYLNDISYPTYYFDLSEDEYNDLKNNKTELNVTIEVSKLLDEEFNLGINVNGYKRTVRFNRDINKIERKFDSYVLKEKNNWIMLEPENQQVNVAELKVEIKVRD